jgi:hypothetical protein
VIQVPITAIETFEDPSINTPEGRLKAFGQEDHVRRYGFDFPERLKEAGFSVDTYRAIDIVKDYSELRRFGIQHYRLLFYAKKSII